MNKSYGLLLITVGWILVFGCRPAEEQAFQFADQGREVPQFNADRAYQYIVDQLEMGPRNPGSQGHLDTRDFLMERLEEYAGESSVFMQAFEHEGYDGEPISMYNLIASFNLQSSDRILLAAHWDTRPRAENDPDRPGDPIPGADDGGSGVAVLLELARIMQENPPPVGVDIIFFDGEDYGESGDLQNYFLGARYWSANPPVPGYQPRFGILLDMVGGENALFPQESYSIRYAPSLVDAVWDVAGEIGYEELFPKEEGALIADDHMIVNRQAGIPMINIIHHRRGDDGNAQFPPYWHTHSDDIDIIDRQTLQAVGELLTEIVFNRIEIQEPAL